MKKIFKLLSVPLIALVALPTVAGASADQVTNVQASKNEAQVVNQKISGLVPLYDSIYQFSGKFKASNAFYFEDKPITVTKEYPNITIYTTGKSNGGDGKNYQVRIEQPGFYTEDYETFSYGSTHTHTFKLTPGVKYISIRGDVAGEIDVYLSKP
ncbi:hypothetical protein [Paenibacillus chitinolyticus]